MTFTSHPDNAACAADILLAYNFMNTAPSTNSPGILLGNGQILNAGVHNIPAAATMNADLILDGQGDPNAVFIFQIQGPFATATNSKVKLINGTKACNVFWKVEGAVSMATGTTMRGTVIANNAAITMTVGDTLEGRAFAIEGAILCSELLAYTPIGCGSPNLTGPVAPTFSASNCYAIFSGNGALGNTPVSNITGDVGNKIGALAGWGASEINAPFALHPTGDASTFAAATDLGIVNSYLLGLTYDIELLFPAQFGHNLVLTPHTYLLNSATSLTDTVYLNGMGNPNAVFVIQIFGAFNASANSRVILTNGTQAKNVFWKINGAVDLGVNSIFYGSMIVDGGAFLLQPGVEIIGRALTITGAITTTAVTVTLPPGVCGVGLPPLIITEPTNQTACTGNSVSFTVSATGTNLSYQWRKGLVNLVDGGNISGAQTATLTINPTTIVDAALDYNVVVSGPAGPSVTSTNVSLTIGAPPIIILEPINQIGCAGDSVSFVVATTGGLTYQWRNGSVDLIDGLTISGSTNNTLTFNPASINDTSSFYNVVVFGACAPNDTSINVSLLINTPPLITIEPLDQSVCSGSSVSFSVTATGSGLTYQWKKGLVNVVDGGTISGAQTATLTINPVSISDTSSNYYVVVSGGCSPNDTSINVSLQLINPIITSEPLDQFVCPGNIVSFSVAATGSGLIYQWRNGTVNMIDGGNISGAQTATLSINPATITDTSSFYNVVIIGGCSPNDTSIFVSFQLGNPIIISEPTNQSVCSGSPVTFSVTATGSALTYQWRNGTINMIDGGNISGAQTATLSINSASITDTSSFYNVVVSGGCSPNDTSIFVSLLINAAPVITIQPLDQTVCSGNSVSFSVTATGSGLTYQWKKGIADVINGATISGAQTATLTINPLSISDTSSNYYVVVTGACSPNDTSIHVSLMLGNPIITGEPINQATCSGSSAIFTVNATGTGLTYQWRKGTVNMIDGGAISGATTSSLMINPVNITDTSSFYNVIVMGACAPNDTSINVSLIIHTAPVITTQPVDQTICEGSSVSFSVNVTGSGITYQWRKGLVDLIDGAPISGATTATLTINPANISDTSSFYNVVISGVCLFSTISVNVSLNVTPTLVVTSNSNSPVCIGNPINLTVPLVTGGTYSWTGPNGYSSTLQNPIIPVSTALDAGVYTLIVTANSCNSLPSAVNVSVNACLGTDLSVIKTVNDTVPFIGSNVVFIVTVTNNGSANATGVEVNEILQSGYVYVSSVASTGTYNVSTGVWTIGNLANGSSATLTITATVIAAGNYVNNALVYGNEPDPNSTNNFSSVETFPTDFNIPEGFSPNGDGINDLFVIRGISNFPENEFTIFNRWGNKAFEASPYKNTWSGKAEMGLRVGGDELPVGIYFYILDLKDGTPVYKGTIYLNR